MRLRQEEKIKIKLTAHKGMSTTKEILMSIEGTGVVGAAMQIE